MILQKMNNKSEKICRLLTERLRNYQIPLFSEVEGHFVITPEYEGMSYRCIFYNGRQTKVASFFAREDVDLFTFRGMSNQFVNMILLDINGPHYRLSREERELMEALRAERNRNESEE